MGAKEKIHQVTKMQSLLGNELGYQKEYHYFGNLINLFLGRHEAPSIAIFAQLYSLH